MKPHIELNIEELVLHGFRPGDRHRIGEAVRLELERLISERGVPFSLNGDLRISVLDGGSFQVSAHNTAKNIGHDIAKSTYGAMGKSADSHAKYMAAHCNRRSEK